MSKNTKEKKPKDTKIRVKDFYGGYDEEEEEAASSYQLAVNGMKGIITVLIYICIFVTMIFIGRESYKIGYNVFNQVSVDTGEGREVTITIEPDMSVMEIGELLQNEGLIEEEPRVFWLQELLSDYHGQISPGTYTLKTGMTPDEMIKSMVETAKEQAEEAAKEAATAPAVESENPEGSTDAGTENTEENTEDNGDGSGEESEEESGDSEGTE